ncbi:lipid A phosphoethanolamine transferase [Halalkalicoccus paucihalophilus]|uniref:Lipid A phosphoethanolamine transferase n=1 Tax=Halalkalicoccus paucihalophilus TaxID=1008153 RepID=A0A151ABD9_9EURY|nr:sulfatase [Halalkalicoccus paucihalophilus]KYH24904.1 lipid A phosphoethanolamine transferase [Halalkalicoccus paucihalophilus]
MTNWENVILLSADALRADHLSCYGYERETSPVLNGLAEESIRFTNAYSASSHTREAVPALLTGEYPDVAIDSSYRLATETIASTLSKEEFATGGFHSNPFVSRAYGFDRGFDTFDDDLHLGQNKFIALAQRAFDKLRNRHYARAEEINKRSLKWLDSLDSEEPFFLWNHYMDTHGPYEPPGKHETLYHDEGLTGRDAQSLYRRAIKDPESITDDERELLIALYDGEIRYNDAKIGEFLEALRERGLLEQSLLIFTSDHGDAFGEHGYYEHPRYLHDEITHVPLLVRPPSGEKDKVLTPASTLDIAATIKQEISTDTDHEGSPLLEMSNENRTVFMQARGEKKDDHLRRYALRTQNGACFCERDRETEAIEFTEWTERSLRDKLEAHVETRVRKENGETSSDDQEVDEEIDRRLEALGYKE